MSKVVSDNYFDRVNLIKMDGGVSI